MPARTTVITTVTKRVNSEIIKLKTSQLLQMAGRAGLFQMIFISFFYHDKFLLKII